MRIDIPRQFPWTQPNRGDVAGSLWATRNLDLNNESGFVKPSKKLIVTTQSSSTATLKTPAYNSHVDFGASVSGGLYGTYIEPSGSAFPVVVASWEETATSASSVTKSITVPSGSNRALVVRVTAYDDGGGTPVTATSVTYNSTGMTSGSGSVSTVGTNKKLYFEDYYLVAPTETTADVVVTFPSANEDIVVQIFALTGVDQSGDPITFAYSVETSAGSPATSLDLIADGPPDRDWETI